MLNLVKLYGPCGDRVRNDRSRACGHGACTFRRNHEPRRGRCLTCPAGRSPARFSAAVTRNAGRAFCCRTRNPRRASLAHPDEDVRTYVGGGRSSVSIPASRAAIAVMSRAASGWASFRAAALIRCSRPGSPSSAAIVSASHTRSSLVSSTTTAAPARSSACALTRWWSSAARGKGTKTAGLPAAVISATVLAPDRHSSKSARAKTAGMENQEIKRKQ